MIATEYDIDRRGWSGGGALATSFVVAMALLVSLTEAGFPIDLTLKAGILAGLYATSAIRLGDHLHRNSPLHRRMVYFLVQFGILSLLAMIFAQHGVFGAVWLFHMPLVAQARMLLPSFGTATIALMSLGTMVAHLYSLSGWAAVPSSLFALSTAIVFVLAFTDFAMREATARADSQLLSAQLEEANTRLGDYAVQAEELAVARERTRMAREIHDSVGHSLTALYMQLQAAQAMLDHDTSKARDALAKASRCAQDGLKEIRQSVSALRTDPLDGRNLHGALAELADQSTSGGLPVRFTVRGRQRPLSPPITLTLYRSAQEGLTNVKKHAEAHAAELELDYGEISHDGVRLIVTDDGVGSDQLDGGFGLIGLGERARQLDGRLDVTSSAGQGLRLVLELPTPLAATP